MLVLVNSDVLIDSEPLDDRLLLKDSDAVLLSDSDSLKEALLLALLDAEVLVDVLKL